MLIPQKEEVISRSPDMDITIAANVIASQTKRITIPRTSPIEALYLSFQITVNTAITSMIGHGILNAVKRITLNLNDGTGAYDAVYAGGPSLIMLADQENIGLDRSTRGALMTTLAQTLSRTQNPPVLAGSIIRVIYPISCPHPLLTEWLRLRSCIPAHRHVQDPILTVDIAASTEWAGSATPITAAAMDLLVVRRDLPADLDKQIIDTGGYIRWDIRESIYDVALSTNNIEKRFAIPGPGEYATLVMAHMLGNTVLTPGDMSANTAFGTETQWRLEAAGNAIRFFRMRHRQMLNDFNRATSPPWQYSPFLGQMATITNAGVTGGAPPIFVTATQTIAPLQFGGALAAGSLIQDPAIAAFDFLGDNFSAASELGSCLNANFPSDAIRWEIVGAVTTPAPQTSNVSLIGRRFRDDITRWKKIPIVQ